jgi:mono/diheme cytochrome c family protein
MALDAKDVATTPAALPAVSAAQVDAPDAHRGHTLFVQICASCHGPDGNMLADHKLSTLKSRRDQASTVAYVKNPKPPMPKMFPDVLSEQNVIDVSAYVLQELSR